MAYSLLSSRILYQTSKYAPVAVVDLQINCPDDASAGISPSLLNAALGEISQNEAGGTLFLTEPGCSKETYCDLVLTLQRYVGHEVAFFRADACDNSRECRVFIEYEDHATALYAADLATDLLNAILESQGRLQTRTISSLRQQLTEFVSFAYVRRLDPNARLLKQAAAQFDIPVLSMDLPWGAPTWPGAAEISGVIQYGWGKRQRQCRGALPLGTLSAEQLKSCLDRASVLAKLKAANLPIPGQDLEFINRNQVRRAQRSAGRIGYPVLARPRVAALPQYGFLDNAAFGPLVNDEQVALVANYFREQARADIWIESFVAGEHYRFLVLGNEVVSVLRFYPPAVVGDGLRAIADLAMSKAQEAKDADRHRTWHLLAKGDDAVFCRLKLAGMSLTSVPVAGESIPLRAEGNHYNGGTAVEVAEQVPARFNALALETVAAVGLRQMAGVDLVIKDLAGGAGWPNCAVTGVDPTPDLVSHSQLAQSDKLQIPKKFFALLFPGGKSTRIPTVAITGTNGKTTTSRMVTQILKHHGLKVGLCCSDGIYLDDEVLLQDDAAGVPGAIEVFANPEMEAAVLETARGGMANMGVAFDKVDVGACLNVADDHLGLEGIETVDQMAVHKRQVIERSGKAVVLNAEDPRCVAMRASANTHEVILFAHDCEHPEISAHVKNGGSAVVVDQFNNRSSVIVKHSHGAMTPVIAVADIPATKNGIVVHNVHNALAATAIAWGLEIPVGSIVSGLEKFVTGIDTTPGRLNEIEGFSFDVLVDAAHNPHGIQFLVRYVDQHVVTGKKIIVFGARAQLPEGTIRKFAALIAGHFDLYILRNYKPADAPGAMEAAVLETIRDELVKHGVAESDINVVPGVLEAIDRGIGCADEGDLVFVQVPAGGIHKLTMIDRIKDLARRAH